jgi:hypothetical protein
MILEKIQIISLTLSISFLLFIFELIRRKKVKEAYAILWLFFAAIFIVLSIWKGGLDYLSAIFGIYYPPAFLFLFLIIAIILILIQFSVVVSGQNEKIKKLTQELGLLKEKLESKSGAKIPDE